MAEKQYFDLTHRRVSLEFVEEPKRIILRIRADKYGDFGDDQEILHKVLDAFSQFAEDKRLLVLDHVNGAPVTKEIDPGKWWETRSISQPSAAIPDASLIGYGATKEESLADWTAKHPL